MRLIMGKTEIDFSMVNHSDLIFNKSVEIPLQDLLTVCQEHGSNCSIFTDVARYDTKLVSYRATF